LLKNFDINITIPLAPVAQKRPRFIRNSFRVYDPSAKDKKPFIKFFQENILNIDFEKLPSDTLFISEKLPCGSNNINTKLPCDTVFINNLQYKSKYVEILINSDEKITKISDVFPLSNPIKTDIIFNISRPKSQFLKGRINPKFITAIPTKSDLDNYIKALLDSSNNFLFNDDRQIFKITAIKQYLTVSTYEQQKPSIIFKLYN